MNVKEFSERFDTLLQSYSSIMKGIQSPLQVDEYEKSVFLTKAQNIIVNDLAKNFEKDEDIRRKLATLVKTATFNSGVSSTGLQTNSLFIQVPSDLLRIVYEKIKVNSVIACFNGVDLDVLPITHDEYNTQKNNPFRKPTLEGLTNKAWRLDTGVNTESVEIILPTDVTINTYTMRYIKNPTPIVLTALGDLSIEGVSTISECQLDSFLLQEQILELGVNLALSAISKSLPQSQ
jgi:hypothetical protein